MATYICIWPPSSLPSPCIKAIRLFKVFYENERNSKNSVYAFFYGWVSFLFTHIKTSHLICSTNKITGICINCNTGLTRVKFRLCIFHFKRFFYLAFETFQPFQCYFSVGDCTGIRSHNHLVRKRTLNQVTKLASLARLLSVRLQTKYLWVRIPLESLTSRCSNFRLTPSQ